MTNTTMEIEGEIPHTPCGEIEHHKPASEAENSVEIATEEKNLPDFGEDEDEDTNNSSKRARSDCTSPPEQPVKKKRRRKKKFGYRNYYFRFSNFQPQNIFTFS